MNRGHHGPTDRGQSNALGVILVLAVVMGGATLVVALGGAGLVDVQSQSELERAENSMTLFDSRAAMVALGDSDVQSIDMVQDTGTVFVEEDTGWLRITHKNYTGDESVDDLETIYNRSLGKVVYRNGDRKIAYQGGGVWRLDGEGDAQMISPPEFHYRGATLTLPIIRVFGSGAASGNIQMAIKPQKQARLIFPNKTTVTGNHVGAPYNTTAVSSHKNYTNAIRNGTVNITVNSEFSHGWETYFKERTTGKTERLGENTVRLTLQTTTGAPGEFELEESGHTIEAGSVGGGHPLTDFQTTLDVDKNNPHFAFYAEESNKEFELHVYSDVNPNSCPAGSGEEVTISTYFYDGDGSNTYESWETDGVDPDAVDGLEWVCDSGDVDLRVNFLDDLTMHYDEIGSSGDFDPGLSNNMDPSCGGATSVTRGNKYAFRDRMKSCNGVWGLRPTSVWDQHEDEGVAYEATQYDDDPAGDDPTTETMDQVVNHYLAALDSEVGLIVKDGTGNRDSIDEPNSSGLLLYETEAGANFVTFLHVTENEIQVDLD